MNASQYNRINELLSEFSKLTAALEAAEAEIKTVQLAAALPLLPKHAQAKVALSNLEADLRKLADAHYDELFTKKRSHETPFGGIKYHKSTALDIADEEKAILKIKLACKDEMDRVRLANFSREVVLETLKPEVARFTADQLIRTKEELNLEALEKLDDLTLAAFGIARIAKDNFKVIPFDMKADKPAKGPGRAGHEQKEAA